MLATKNDAISTIFRPQWICFGARCQVELNDSLLFYMFPFKHFSNKFFDDIFVNIFDDGLNIFMKCLIFICATISVNDE